MRFCLSSPDDRADDGLAQDFLRVRPYERSLRSAYSQCSWWQHPLDLPSCFRRSGSHQRNQHGVPLHGFVVLAYSIAARTDLFLTTPAGSAAVILSARASENLTPLEVRSLLTTTAKLAPVSLSGSSPLVSVIRQGGGTFSLSS